MSYCVWLALYGQTEALQKAKGMLENLPKIRSMRCSADLSQMKLVSSEPLYENSLLPLLAQSGISGFRLV